MIIPALLTFTMEAIAFGVAVTAAAVVTAIVMAAVAIPINITLRLLGR